MLLVIDNNVICATQSTFLQMHFYNTSDPAKQ